MTSTLDRTAQSLRGIAASPGRVAGPIWRWPEETPSQGRRWTLPAGVVTYEQEQARLRETALSAASVRETAGRAA